MKIHLQAQLYAKYPKIFRDKDLPMTQTCMCWGLECGGGWYDLLDHLCYAMTWTYQTSVKTGEGYTPVEPPQVVADQVKEKFGTLSFYYHLELDEAFTALFNDNPDAQKTFDRYQAYFDGMVHMAEILSGRTCEETGLPGELHVTGNRYGWYKTLNREFAKTDPFCVSRGYVPVSDLSKEPEEMMP